jgi:hypothetical protein
VSGKFFIQQREKENMMKCALWVCATLLLAAVALGQTSTPMKPKKSPAATEAEVQVLREEMAAQQAEFQRQLQQLRDELHRKDQALEQAQSTATTAAGKADAAQAQATQEQEAVVALKTDVTDLKGGMQNTALSLQETQTNFRTINDAPTALHFKGITITPGGFLAAEFVRRSRALGADINTPFNSLSMPGSSQTKLSEFFGSGRQSRVSMLAEGHVKAAKLSGYVEADFLSAGVTSNNNQSNSYTLRQRQAWGQAAFENGWAFTGGQMWSLVTETRHGVDNRTETPPMTIDPQYNVGFSWARQYGLRVSKNIENKVWLAVAVENAQATVTTHGNGTNYLIGSSGNGGGLYNSATTNCTTSLLNNNPLTPLTVCSFAATYSFNPSPDIVAKLVFEPGFGHYEIFGAYSRFRNRVFPCGDVVLTQICPGASSPGPSTLGAYNSSRDGFGLGANARWSVLHKHIDIGVHGFGGNGVGRYGSAGLPDATVRANGTLRLLRGYQGLGTLEWHGPKMDIYVNGGMEYISRGFELNSNVNSTSFNTYVGYGAGGPGAAFLGGFNDSGCFSETIPGSGGFIPGSLSKCTADTRFIAEGTAGFWFKVYDGSKDKINFGRIQWGPQLSYVDRQSWSGVGGEPHGLDTMVFTSFRYYLP